MTRRPSLAAFGFALLATTVAHADDACHATSDCHEGFKCVWNYCVPTHEQTTEDPWAARHERAAPSTPTFVGLTLGLGALNGGYTSSETTLWGGGVDATVLLALRVGVLFHHLELAVEIAPFTDFWDLRVEKGPAFEANATAGLLIPIGSISGATLLWPLRIGLGVLAGGDNTGADVFFEGRLDAIGLAAQRGPIVLEVDAPSFRYAVTNGHVPGIPYEGVTTHYLSFFVGSSVSYLF
jgi:hypothetical protein